MFFSSVKVVKLVVAPFGGCSARAASSSDSDACIKSIAIYWLYSDLIRRPRSEAQRMVCTEKLWNCGILYLENAIYSFAEAGDLLLTIETKPLETLVVVSESLPQKTTVGISTKTAKIYFILFNVCDVKCQSNVCSLTKAKFLRSKPFLAHWKYIS